MSIVFRHLPHERVRLAVLLLLSLISSFSGVFPARAAFFDPGCTGGMGDAAALQAAVTTASSNSQADFIELEAGCIYTLSAVLAVGADGGNLLTITGNGATVSGNNSLRVFEIAPGANVSIQALTITLANTTTFGGGIYNAGTLSLTDTYVNNNRTTSLGGGIFNSGSLTLTRSTINSNQAFSSGGMFNNGGTVTLVGSTIRGNTAGSIGGFNSQGGTVTLTNSTVALNSVTGGGGVGAFQSSSGATVTLNNSTVAANTAGTNSGIQNFASLAINNSIIANHIGSNCVGINVTVSYSLIEGGGCGVTNGVNGNLTADPALGAITGNPAYYPISTSSIALGAGSNALIPGGVTTDQVGNNRIRGGTVDMGSFEAACPAFPVTVAAGSTSALAHAVGCANENSGDNVINLTSGTHTLSATLVVANNGALSINGNGSTISGGDAVRVFTVDPSAALTLNGLTISEGLADQGAGVYVGIGGILTLTYSILQDNEATGDGTGGGAIYSVQGSVSATDTAFIDNRATVLGGGILNKQGTVMLTDTTFEGNFSNLNGGAIYTAQGTLTVNGSTFRENESGAGGGIQIINTTVNVIDSTFAGNIASYGAGIYNFGMVTVTNSTFSANNAGFTGGAIDNGGFLTMTNTTLSGGSAPTGGGGGIYNTGTATVNNSIIANSPTGGNCIRTSGTINAQNSLIEGALTCINGTNTNNLTGDPGLGVLRGSPQYFPITTNSIAYNSGNNALIPGGITTDQAGNARIAHTTVDRGSYEVPASSVIVTLTLQGRPAGASTTKVITVHVQVRPTGSLTPISSQNYGSDTNGQVSISGLVTGTYDIWIKGTHTLAVLHNVALIPGENLLTTALLLEGDANDDNLVALTDFSILASSFGTQVGDGSYDARADFNQDGVVTIVDFSLLANNFGQAGAP